MHFCFLQKKAIQDGLASHSAWLLAAPIVPVIEEPPPTYHPNILSFTAKKRLDCRPSKQVATRSPERATAPRLGWYSLVLTQVVRRVWSQCFRLALDVHAAQTIVPA